MSDTKTKILEATEKLIIQNGWDKVTFRMITSEAEVNLAAINYHFGSREALEEALLSRMIGPIEDKRIERLDQAEQAAGEQALGLEEIIQSFLDPVLEFSESYPNHHKLMVNLFLGTQDKARIRSHFREKLNPVIIRYSKALFRALPDLSKETILTRFIFLFYTSSIFLRPILFEEMYDLFGKKPSLAQIRDEMVKFFGAGFQELEHPQTSG